MPRSYRTHPMSFNVVTSTDYVIHLYFFKKGNYLNKSASMQFIEPFRVE